jgi:transcriptional regulator with XRE-family HTH domain
MARPRSPAHAALGRALRELREHQRLSQETLAFRSGLHRNYVGGIERGERNPSYTNILKLAEVVGVQASRLLELAEEQLDEPPTRQ